MRYVADSDSAMAIDRRYRADKRRADKRRAKEIKELESMAKILGYELVKSYCLNGGSARLCTFGR